MGRSIRSIWLAMLGGGLLLGCESAGRRHYPQDPLLLSKKPVEGKPTSAGPDLIAQAEPAPPPVPAALALAAAVKLRAMPALAVAELPAASSDASESISKKEPVRAIPASRSVAPGPVAGTLAVRRQVPGTYGHAADYGWLQGVLEKHSRGHLDLRYCDPGVEDKWGGKVSLEEDPRLTQFKEGDVILVEGELRAPDPVAGHRLRYAGPRYQIRQIWLAQPR